MGYSLIHHVYPINWHLWGPPLIYCCHPSYPMSHLSGHPWKLWGEQEREKQGQIWQCVKTLYPCSSHQNSWDLWMFIPLKMVHRYWPIPIWLWRVYQSLPVMAAEKRSLSMQTYTIPFHWQSGTVPDQANCIDLDSDAEGCYNSPAGCGTRFWAAHGFEMFWSPLCSLIFPYFPLQRWSNDQICDFEGCPVVSVENYLWQISRWRDQLCRGGESFLKP